MFVNIKPLHVSVFFHDHLQGVFRRALCLIIQTQRTQISGRKSNGTKHSGGSPEDGREKRPKHVGVLYLHTHTLRAVSTSVCKPEAANTVEVPDDERHNARNMLNYQCTVE